MKKSILFIAFFLVISFSLAQAVPVDATLLRQLIYILQRIVQGTTSTPIQQPTQILSISTPIPEATKVQPIPLPRGIQPAVPIDKPITPEVLKPILPDENREDDYIVQINNLRITRIVENPMPDTRAVFFAVRDTGWKCMRYESEESTQTLPCFTDIRRSISQKELAIQITNDTILLLRNRQKAKLSDFQVGDKINVYGFMDKDNFGVEALIVRNLGVRKPILMSPTTKPPISTTSPAMNSITGYLTKTEVSIYMWGIHQLKGDDGNVYQIKANNVETSALLDKYSDKRVKIYGKVEYQTMEGGFWSIVAEKVELLSVPTIPEVKIISPNGGEKWFFGTYQEIKWFASQDKTVSIYLKEYISCLYEEPKCLIPEPKSYAIVENFENRGSYLWQIGELQNKLLINSGEYLIIVTGNQSLKSDQSDKPFRIEVSNTQSLLTKEIIGYLTKIDVSDPLLGTHLLIGDDGKIYPVKGENNEVTVLLDKNLGKKVKISGILEYKTIEKNFWLIIANNIEILEGVSTELQVPIETTSTIDLKIEADDYGFYPSSVEVSKGSTVILTFVVRDQNVYYGGLDFRSDKFKTDPVKPGQTTTVKFIADQDFVVSSYWPLSNVKKADLKIIVK